MVLSGLTDAPTQVTLEADASVSLAISEGTFEELVWGASVSDDVAFDGVPVVIGQGTQQAVRIYATTQGTFELTETDGVTPIASPLRLRSGGTTLLQLSAIPAVAYSLGDVSIPVLVPNGFSASPSVLFFSAAQLSQAPSTGVAVPITIQAPANATTGQQLAIQFGPGQSQDAQWNLVPVLPSSLAVEALDEAELLVSSAALGVLVGGQVNFTVAVSTPPYASVRVSMTAPAGFGLALPANAPAQTLQVELPAGSTDPITVTVTAMSSSESVPEALIRLQAAQSIDVQYDGVAPSSPTISIYSTFRGKITILQASSSLPVAEQGFRLLASSAPFDAPINRVGLLIKVERSRYGQSSALLTSNRGFLPFVLPPGFTFTSEVQQSEQGLSFDMGTASRSSFYMEVVASATPAPIPAPAIVQSTSSGDVQWDGVGVENSQAGPFEFLLSSVSRGSIEVSTTGSCLGAITNVARLPKTHVFNLSFLLPNHNFVL